MIRPISNGVFGSGGLGEWCWKEMFAKLHKVLLAKRVNLVCSLGGLEMIAFDKNLDAKVLKTML